MSAQMQEKMNQQQQQANTGYRATKDPATPANKSDDYIDFEEVK
jgi:hypothetical protein